MELLQSPPKANRRNYFTVEELHADALVHATQGAAGTVAVVPAMATYNLLLAIAKM